MKTFIISVYFAAIAFGAHTEISPKEICGGHTKACPIISGERADHCNETYCLMNDLSIRLAPWNDMRVVATCKDGHDAQAHIARPNWRRDVCLTHSGVRAWNW